MFKMLHGMTAVPKAKQLLIALVLGVGLTLGLLEMLIAFRSGVGISPLQTVRAAGPLYVATSGSDEGNGCTESANPCATVQHAVDVAEPGDEIRVATGVYTGMADEYVNASLQGCDAYPIALHVSSLEGLAPGDPTGVIRNGMGSGNFGWLRWTDDTEAVSANPNSEEYLAEELNNPHLAVTDYREPEHKDPDDTSLNAGDWV